MYIENKDVNLVQFIRFGLDQEGSKPKKFHRAKMPT